MAAAANHSPRNSGGGGGDASAINSPRSKRGAAARGVTSSWTQVVRGAESESFPSSTPLPPAAVVVAAPLSPSASAAARGQINNSSPDWSPSKAAVTAAASFSSSSSSPDHSAAEAQSENSDNGTGSGNAGKKQVWNKPSNDAVEIGAVMGAVSWPALSESTRASPKSSSADSSKAVSDSVSIPQGTGVAASSTQKQIFTSNTNPSLTPNHVTPTRQKSMKRGGGSSSGNVTANGGFPQPSPPLGAVGEMPYNNAGNSGLAVPESSPRDLTPRESGQRGGFGQSHSGNDHPPQRNSFRRGNGNSYPRGDGSYHHNFGGNHDRGNHERNSHRNFSGRDAHMHPQRGVPRGFIPPPPPSSIPFIPPPPPVPMQPFGNAMLYPEVPSPVFYVPAPSPDSLRGVPLAQMAPHAMYFNVPGLESPASADSHLHAIVKQIDYYFSNENLVKDTFLRQNMDGEGWVPISLIAGFKKVKKLTTNIPHILDALRSSTLVEVQGDKVRKRDHWRTWVMPPAVQFE